MAKYYYNDVLLPEIPSDIPASYTYKIIRNDTNNSRYDLIFSDTPWHYDSGGVLARKQATSTMLRYYINHADAEMATEWVFLEENDKSTNFGVSSTRPLVWSNSDIKNASGSSVYFVGSEPVPEGGSEPEPEYKEKYVVKSEWLVSVADEVRRLTNSEDLLTVDQIETVLKGIEVGGGDEVFIKADDVAFTSEHSDTTDLYAMGYNWFADLVGHIQDMAGTKKAMTPEQILYNLGRVKYIPCGVAETAIAFDITSNAVGVLPDVQRGFGASSILFNITSTATGEVS